LIEVDEAPEALIRERGVGVAIAEHDVAAISGRTDDFHRVLPPRRREQQHFGDRIDHVLRVEKNRADPIGDVCAARLLRCHDGPAALAQQRRQPLQLRRLARTLDPFECDEHGGRL